MTSSNVASFHDHKIEKLLTEIKHGLAVHDAGREALIKLLGFTLKTKDSPKGQRYWLIKTDTGKVVFGGKRGRDECDLEFFLEEEQDRIAIELGFTCASSMRCFARLLNGDMTPEGYGERYGVLTRAFQFYREALHYA
jgi:hypothetical protein